ncbi:Fe-S protein assembly co-chaperone HscB [Tepidimonas charontis]|uniref:Fe-S protein assembly co-chaperone HscB n=1 Tax=Tepidimonas charontis TaxID=2267262 RepID=UPI001F01F6DF|nr:Fe-S protein assembly co-chaperone HscB [Tepidimonas charontis]
MSEPSLSANDFALFGLPQRFALDAALLQERWKALQRLAHPDRHAHAGAAAQRLAMQWSVRVNEAYQRLRDPLRRAAYWCELQGQPVQADSNTAMPAEFLLQQMQWREALEEARDPTDLQRLRHEVQAERDARLQTLAAAIDTHHDAAAAAAQVRALMFIERFLETLHERLDT